MVTRHRHIIYGLVDPESLLVRYVGRSVSGLKRPKQHFCESSLKLKDHCHCWIKSVINKGLIPKIIVIERFQNTHDVDNKLNEAEKYWISFVREHGKLTNMTDGGSGVSGYKQSPELIEKRASKLRGVKRPKEVGNKISKSLKGRSDVYLTCSHCLKEFKRIRSRVRGKHNNFCSRECVDKFKVGKRPYERENKNGY